MCAIGDSKRMGQAFGETITQVWWSRFNLPGHRTAQP